jgi:glycine cleavage system aminomethyltransferase T
MGEFAVTGAGALAALQALTPNDVGKLTTAGSTTRPF